MRILKVITRIVRGGAAGTMITVARELAERGHAVTCCHGPAAVGEGICEPELAESGARTLRIETLVRDPDARADLSALRALLAELSARSYDVVHTYTSKAGFLGRLAAALSRVPAVVHSAQGHIFAEGGRIPGVSDRPARRAFFLVLERLATPWADRLVALSASEADAQVALGIAPRKRFVVIPNPVEDRFFDPPPLTADRDGAAFVAVSVARLTAEKGHALLLSAFARLRTRRPGAVLWFVGDGPERTALESRVAADGLSGSIRFWGLQRDVRPFLAAADCLVLPSAYEAQGVAILEAYAAGRPVVATDVGGVSAFVADGETGSLVPPGDATRMAEAMETFAADPALAGRLGRAGRAFAERFRPAAAADRLEALYREILAEKRGVSWRLGG